jgi:uncharacterized protein YukE
MTKLHMETEQVRQIARQLDQKALDLLSKASMLSSISGRLSVAWQGGRSESYVNTLRSLIRKYESQIQQLQDLALRVYREVDEWENTDCSNNWEPSLAGMTPMISPAGTMIGQGQAIGVAAGLGSTMLATYFVSEMTLGGEGSLLSQTGQGDWHREGWSPKVEAKAGLGGALEQGKYHSWGKWEAGAKAGVDEKGVDAGLYMEGSVFEAERSTVVGSSMFGFTLTGAVAAGSVEGFAGIRDNTIGASAGASLASGELGLGLNLFGINVSLLGGLSAGLEAGVQIGAETEGKLGPFKVGLSFGNAITE